MIKFTDDIKQISKLWQIAFGDNDEDVVFFADNLKNGKCIGYFIDETLVSMLYLIECRLDDFEYEYVYVYAANTLPEYRGNGYMAELLNFVKKEYKYICLIPANEGLIEFYKNNEFFYFSDISKLVFDECEALINDYLYEGCNLDRPVVQVYKGDM